MSKWKCEICNKEFDNFHAQGFNNKIYCPLCYFKEENEYDEIINGKETFKQIAQLMKENKSCIIGWTDEEYTHYDILFSKSVYKEFANYLQRGLRESDLYVSIIGIGAFGFKTDNVKEPGYIAEKLFGNRIDESVIMVSHLINGIIQEMMEK